MTSILILFSYYLQKKKKIKILTNVLLNTNGARLYTDFIVTIIYFDVTIKN